MYTTLLQGMGMIVASLLLFLPEEEAFWCVASIVQELLPLSYYSNELWGAQADQAVLRSLLATRLPALHSLFTKHNIELSLVTLHWFLTLYASALNIRLLVNQEYIHSL